jgi:hypothetical protein
MCREIETLQHYVGVASPWPCELKWATRAIAASAVLLLGAFVV